MLGTIDAPDDTLLTRIQRFHHESDITPKIISECDLKALNNPLDPKYGNSSDCGRDDCACHGTAWYDCCCGSYSCGSLKN
ncbi:MAG: hypothetical protein WC979_08005 [Candidatus Pacearchaeota archaeon]|jgi:hypothetical protein